MAKTKKDTGLGTVVKAAIASASDKNNRGYKSMGDFFDQTVKIPVYGTYTSIFGRKNKNKDKPYETYGNLSNYNDFNTTTTTGGSYSGSGTKWYDVQKRDISDLLKAYKDQYDTNVENTKSSYATKRSDLLKSIERFRENNAKDVQNQKQDYLSQQANLESARESANRQTRISNAARGLGGSGLQQLAQLQNQIAQGEQISEAAGENQKAMDNLASLLRQAEEDYDTDLKTNRDEESRALKQLLADYNSAVTAKQDEVNADYENAKRARDAAVSSYSYSSSPGTTTTNNIGNAIGDMMPGLMVEMRKIANSKKTYKTKTQKMNAIKTLLDGDAAQGIDSKYGTTVRQALEAYGNDGWYDSYKRDINNALKSYGLSNYYK